MHALPHRILKLNSKYAVTWLIVPLVNGFHVAFASFNLFFFIYQDSTNQAQLVLLLEERENRMCTHSCLSVMRFDWNRFSLHMPQHVIHCYLLQAENYNNILTLRCHFYCIIKMFSRLTWHRVILQQCCQLMLISSSHVINIA